MPSNDIETWSNNRKYPDSSVYWINEDYLNEIKTGMDVCECMSRHPFLLVYIDSLFENIIIQSSVFHFGLETTAEVKLVREDTLNRHFSTEKSWPLNEEMEISVEAGILTINYDQKVYRFVAKKLKTLDIPSTPKGIFVQSVDIYDQLNRINAETLLAYKVSKDDASLLSSEELNRLISSNLVSIGCSDDYHYNSMLIQGDTNRYFHIEFGDGIITLYEEPNGRGRYEKLDLSKLKKQTLYNTFR